MAERTLTYAEAIQEAIDQEMTRDPAVYVLGEDVAVWGNLFGCTKGLLAKYGKDRVRDTPISEAALMGCAVGSAAAGMRPVAEIMYIDFISIALDQIINHAARWHQLSAGKVTVPLVVRTQGGVGFRNSSQHSQSLENWFVNIPGLVVVMPATPYDVKGLLKAAIRNDNPVIFIEHKAIYRNKGPVPVDDYVLPLGVAEVKRAGSDLTIVATSWMVLHALAAAEELAKSGISAEVVDPRTLYPLDEKTICDSVRKTGRCLVVNEAPAAGGFSGEISSVIMEQCFASLKKPVKRLCGQRTGVPYDKDLERAVVPGVADVVREARALAGKVGAPVAAPVVMPKFGQTMTEGTVVSWEKQVGQAVKKGDVLLRIETDKSEMEVEADTAGTLLRIDVQPGTMVPCGTVIAWIGEKGEAL